MRKKFFFLKWNRNYCVDYFQGIKAREILQEAMAKIIQEKLEKKHTEEYCDAFDYMLSSAKENDYDMTLQELKVSISLP